MTQATELWLEESPMDWVEGEAKTYSIAWTGKVSGTGPDSKLYRNNQDVSAQCMSGTDTITNGTPPVQTLKQIYNLVGGEEYVLVVQATVDGQQEKHKCLIRCVKPGATQ